MKGINDDITNNSVDVDREDPEETVEEPSTDVPTFKSSDFKKLNIEKLMSDRKNFSAIMYGKRRSGKSLMLKDILSKIHTWFKEAYVFSETIDLQPDLFDYIPSNNRYNSFDQDKLQEIWNTQEKYMKHALISEKDKSKLNRVLVIFDDVIQDPHIRSSQIFNRLYTAGRHNNFCVICLSQEVGGLGGINKVSRRNSDLIFCFYMESEYDRNLIAEQFLAGQSKKIGKQLIVDITTPAYQCMVFDCTSTKHEYTDFVYTYTASTKVPKFMIGRNNYRVITVPPKTVKTKGSKGFKTLGYTYKVPIIPVPDRMTMSDGRLIDSQLNVGNRMGPRQVNKII